MSMRASVIKNNICEFCNKQRKYLSANSIHGYYCTDCLRLARKEDAESLFEIRLFRQKDKLKRGQNERK